MELAMEKIISIRQEGTVHDYCNEFEFLLSNVKISEEFSEYYAVYCFIFGLRPEIGEFRKSYHNIDRSLSSKMAFSMAKIQETSRKGKAMKLDRNQLSKELITNVGILEFQVKDVTVDESTVADSKSDDSLDTIEVSDSIFQHQDEKGVELLRNIKGEIIGNMGNESAYKVFDLMSRNENVEESADKGVNPKKNENVVWVEAISENGKDNDVTKFKNDIKTCVICSSVHSKFIKMVGYGKTDYRFGFADLYDVALEHSVHSHFYALIHWGNNDKHKMFIHKIKVREKLYGRLHFRDVFRLGLPSTDFIPTNKLEHVFKVVKEIVGDLRKEMSKFDLIRTEIFEWKPGRQCCLVKILTVAQLNSLEYIFVDMLEYGDMGIGLDELHLRLFEYCIMCSASLISGPAPAYSRCEYERKSKVLIMKCGNVTYARQMDKIQQAMAWTCGIAMMQDPTMSWMIGILFAVVLARKKWMDKEGKTPLTLASMNPQFYDVAKTLIELGANVNAYRPGCYAGPVLHHAEKRGLESMIELLLSHNANALVLNDDCQTALNVARVKGFSNVVCAIENHICLFSKWLQELYGPPTPTTKHELEDDDVMQDVISKQGVTIRYV